MNKQGNNDLAHNMEPAFLRAFYSECTQLPDYLLANYREIGLSDGEFIALLRVLACCRKGQNHIRPDELLAQWRGDKAELSAALAALHRQGVLQPVDAEHSGYTLAGLYAKLLELWVFQHCVPPAASAAPAENAAEPAAEPKPELTEIIKAAYQLFEGEFARPLSPLEMEKLNAWLIADQWDFAMLKEAMRRAVLHNALNLAYIDKILLRWKREGIASLEQLQASEEQSLARSSDKTKGRARESKANRAGKPKAAEPSFSAEDDYSRYF